MYKFTSTIKLEKSDRGKRNFIQTYFLSADNDTLKVPDQYVGSRHVAPLQERLGVLRGGFQLHKVIYEDSQE